MKYFSTKLPVKDLEYSSEFYTKTLGLPVTCHYGHSILLDNHLLLTTKETPGSGKVCIYLEAKEYYKTEAKLLAIGHSPDYRYSPAGQRIMILRDPEGNNVEIGESMGQIVTELLSLSKYSG